MGHKARGVGSIYVSAVLEQVVVNFEPILQGAPFPQIDIIGAVVIVWRVRGKIIRYVLCSIVCNSCAQCNAHTHMNRPNISLDWVLSHWAHLTVLRFIFVYHCVCCIL